ncbi:MAG TPA: hypothetical protein VGU90_04560 [Terriglobales bacterium]|nr:hypothetical protein [Terriglobales bacterium]
MIRNLTLAALAFAVFAGTIGYAAAQDHRYYDRDDYRYHRDYDRDGDRHYDFREGMQTARQIGFQDGAQVAREDSWRGKPFNPYPRGHNRAERGYEREFGSRHEYREHYAQAYYDGYSRAFQGYRNSHRNGYYR